MTEFIYKPYMRVYVRDIVNLSLDDFIAMIASLESVNAYWIDGVMFVSFAMAESEELAKKEIQDEMYIDRILFTRSQKYSKTARSSNNLEIGVINVEKSAIYRDMIHWLKTQDAWTA